MRAVDDWSSGPTAARDSLGRGWRSGRRGRPQGGPQSLPLFWNALDLLARHRVMARWLCDSNAFAIGFSGRLTDYHIRKGFGWQACLKGAKKTPYATVRR